MWRSLPTLQIYPPLAFASLVALPCRLVESCDTRRYGLAPRHLLTVQHRVAGLLVARAERLLMTGASQELVVNLGAYSPGHGGCRADDHPGGRLSAA